MSVIYGYIYNTVFIETGLSERGAKIAASKAGALQMGYRSPINNMYIRVATKTADGWEYTY